MNETKTKSADEQPAQTTLPEQLTPEHLFGVLTRMKRSVILDHARKARALARKNACGNVCDMIEAVDRMKKKP